MSFISLSEVKKFYISWVPKARMKYIIFHFTRWNKSHIHDKNLNFLFIILHVVIVTLRAKAYDVKILNDVITSRHYVAIVCERSLLQQ